MDKNPPAPCAKGHRFDPWIEKIPHAIEQLNLDPQLLSLHVATPVARVPRACAPQQEKPLQREAHAMHLESSLWSQLEIACIEQLRPSAANKYTEYKITLSLILLP